MYDYEVMRKVLKFFTLKREWAPLSSADYVSIVFGGIDALQDRKADLV